MVWLLSIGPLWSKQVLCVIYNVRYNKNYDNKNIHEARSPLLAFSHCSPSGMRHRSQAEICDITPFLKRTNVLNKTQVYKSCQRKTPNKFYSNSLRQCYRLPSYPLPKSNFVRYLALDNTENRSGRYGCRIQRRHSI